MRGFKKLLKHLFVPHKGNTFRPHALRHKALSIYSVGLILSQLLLGITFYSGPVVKGDLAEKMSQNIITYSNFERRNNNLPGLYLNETLSKAAKEKLDDMFAKNYWDHKGPYGETAWQFIESSGYQYQLAGENLARGFSNPEEAVKAWMNSPTHRANLLNNRFQEIGVAVGSGKINGNETTLIVQLFGEPKNLFAAAEKSEVLGEKNVLPEISALNVTAPSKTPYFVIWALLFGLIMLDGIMIRRLGLHASPSHVFNMRVSLLASLAGLVLLTLGFVAIA